MLAGAVAVMLAVVGSVAGITVAQRGGTDGIRYEQVPVGAGGTDSNGDGTSEAANQAIFNGTGSAVAAGPTGPGGGGGTGKAAPPVAPMKNRVDPDVLVVAKNPITAEQLTKVKRTTKADSVLQVDGARVKLGEGTTTAVGVDPSTFRNVAPDNTAQVDALWQRVASGDVAVAHAVASALGVNLGDRTKIGRETQKEFRVGAFATTRLAGVGVVADRSRSADLGLVKGAVLVLKLPKDADPVSAAAAAQQAVPESQADALRYVVNTGSAQSGGPTVSGGLPVLGRGWTLPLRSGTFSVSQGFGVKNGRDGANGHPGLDMASPFGTPIYAASAGSVLYWGPARGFGNWIVLQHPGGVQTLYGHMRYQDLLIPPNAQVKAGQNIALVGNEGNSTGPHLHFEVRLNNQRTDPVAFLNAQGVVATVR